MTVPCFQETVWAPRRIGMLLNHGGISFPVGTQLDVEEISRLVRDAQAPTLSAVVVDNTPKGLRLVWCSQTAGE